MKKGFVLAIAITFCALTPFFADAKGNPLKNIPVTDVFREVQNAKISIDDFTVEGDQIWVTSTLTGTTVFGPISQTVTYPITIVTSTCNQLTLSPETNISSEDFHIANFVVTVSAGDIKDKRLEAALCSIADLEASNASLYTIVARIKQAVRALL